MKLAIFPRLDSQRLRPRCGRSIPAALVALASTALPASAQLINGGVVSESISPSGDQDTWTFTASAGEGFQLQLADVNATALVPLMDLYDPNGTLLETRWNTDVATMTRTAAIGGTYSVVVRDGNANPIQTGAYDLYFTRAPGANEGGLLPNGGSVVGSIALGDLDSYTFTANVGQGFQIQMGDLGGTALVPMIRLYDPNGALLETRWNTDVAAITRTAATSGTYTVVLSDGNTQPSQTGAYQVFLTRAPGANEGGLLPNGGLASDTITIGDLDSYTFVAAAGEGFQLQMADVNATALFPMMRLYDPTGALIDTRWNTSVASIVRTASIAGTYTVVASDGNTQPSQTGAYDLFFSLRPGANEGGTLPNGGVVSGSIVLGDLDSYTFDANVGEGFQVQMADVNATALFPMIRLYDPNGALLETRWNTDVATITRTAATSGTHTVVVSDGNTQPAQVGNYDLYFTLAPGASEGGALPNGGSIDDAVDLGDLDSYTFEASPGEGFQIQVADLGGTALFPMIRVYDPNGALLETRWNTEVASVTRTAAVGGVHTVVVSDGNTQPSKTGAYRIYFTRAPGANEGGKLPNGGSVLDAVDKGDLDSYTFPALAGEDFQITMTDLNATSLIPLMRLYGPTGTLLQNATGTTVATIVRTAATTGTYTLVVSDGNSQPAQTGAYVLGFLRGLETYCTAGITASGCSASISATGDPSLSLASGFVLRASGAEGAKDGLFFFAANGRQANPWGNGTSYQCVVPPVKRSPVLSGGGSNGACDGDFQLDFNALLVAQPSKAPPSGAKVQVQCWFRDPANTSNQSTSLSDALEFSLHP